MVANYDNCVTQYTLTVCSSLLPVCLYQLASSIVFRAYGQRFPFTIAVCLWTYLYCGPESEQQARIQKTFLFSQIQLNRKTFSGGIEDAIQFSYLSIPFPTHCIFILRSIFSLTKYAGFIDFLKLLSAVHQINIVMEKKKHLSEPRLYLHRLHQATFPD